MVFVIPNFQKVFADLAGGKGLPGLTEFVLSTSRFIAKFWYLIFILPIAFFGLLKLIRLSDSGAFALDRMRLWWPIFGAIITKSNTTRFTRTLGTLVASGVPILDALDIIKAATPNLVYSRVIQLIHENIRQGGTVADPMDNSPIFDDMVVNMVRVGEETGELDRMLLRISDSYDDEVDNLVQGLVSILEPAIIVFMGLAVGTIVISLFLPLISLMNRLSERPG